MPGWRWVITCITMIALMSTGRAAAGRTDLPLAADPATVPLVFMSNSGQFGHEVKFSAQALGGQVYFTPSGVGLALPAAETMYHALAVRFVGANPQPEIQGLDPLPARVNLLRGANPSRWITGLVTYASVVYKELYPGIDARYDGSGGVLKGTFVVAPQADPALIRWSYAGTTRTEIADSGDLLVHLDDGSVFVERAPTAWQDIGGQQIPVAARFIRQGDVFGLAVEAYQPAYPLLLDPVLEYSTFIGGSSRDVALGVDVDSAGYVYVVGLTDSPNFPVTPDRVGETLQGTRDAFVMKLDPQASGAASLVWATYLGGTHPETQYSYYGADEAYDVAVDAAGHIYVTGITLSNNFPVTASAYMPERPPSATPYRLAFLSKLSNDGANLLYSTYLGGSLDNFGKAVAADNSGNAYVGGMTQSMGQPGTLKFPTTDNAFDPVGTSPEFIKNFVARIDTSQSGAASLVYSTFLGGTSTTNSGIGMAADESGSVFVTGVTRDTAFPTTANAYQRTISRNPDSGLDSDEVFISQLDTTQANAASLIYSTFLGGGWSENWGELPAEHYPRTLAPDIAVADGIIYITGYTMSPDFPIVNGFQTVKGSVSGGSLYGPYYDAFVARINPQKSGAASLEYSTFLGGTQFDAGTGIAATRQGNVYVTGTTAALNFPLRDAIQLRPYGAVSAFAVKIDTNLSGDASLVYSTYVGRNSVSHGGIAVDGLGTAYIVGAVNDAGFPVVAGFQPAYGGATDGFLVKLAFRADLQVTKTMTPDPAVVGEPVTITIKVKNKGPETATAIFMTEILPSTVLNFVSATTTQGSCQYAASVLRCSLGYLENQRTASITITVIPHEATLFPPPEGMMLGPGALPAEGDLPTVLATADGVEQDVNAADNSAERPLAVYTFDTFMPTLLEPSGITANTRPVFRWQPIPGAVAYEFQLDRADLDTAVMITLGSSTYQPAASLLTAAYRWRVRAVNSAGVRTVWSAPGTVMIAAPNTAAPKLNFFETLTIPLSWNRIPWAAGYRLHIARDAAFSKLLAQPTFDADTLSYIFTAPSDGVYYWRVQALRAGGGTPSAWSATGIFVVEQ